MKKLVFLLACSILLLDFSNTFAQPGMNPGMGSYPRMFNAYGRGNAKNMIAINSGNIGNLKGVSRVNLVYDYSETGVEIFRIEQEYLNFKKQEFKDDSVKFAEFRKNWFHARENYFEPEFEKIFNSKGKGIGLSGQNYATSNVITLKVATIFMVTGFTGKDVNGPASIDLECTFLDEEGHEILRYYIKNASGTSVLGRYMDPGARLTTSYAKAAEMLIKDIQKKLKKTQ